MGDVVFPSKDFDHMKFLLLLGWEVCSNWKFDFYLGVTCPI